MRVALAQTTPVLGAVASNLAAAHEYVASTVREGADLVIFPELSLSGYPHDGALGDTAVTLADSRLDALSRTFPETLIAVGFPERDGNATYNAAALLHAGRVRHVYRKIYVPHYNHLREGDVFDPGATLTVAPHLDGSLALMICEDMVQPGLGLLASQQGALLLIVMANSAASPTPEFDAASWWSDMTRFFALAFQTFVVFVNRTGTEGSLAFWGGSRVVGPDGRLRSCVAGTEPGLILADIDVQEAARLREAVPVLRSARLDVLARELRRLHDERTERQEEP